MRCHYNDLFCHDKEMRYLVLELRCLNIRMHFHDNNLPIFSMDMDYVYKDFHKLSL